VSGSLERQPSSRRLRILQVVPGLPLGGLEKGVINLLNGLAGNEFAQAVCCLDERGEMAARVAADIPIHVLDRTRHDLALPVRLARVIRDWRPDVIHCRNLNTWLATLQAHWFSGRRGALVWSLHGFLDGHVVPRRCRIASRLLALSTDRLFAVCRDYAERFSALSTIPRGRFDVLYNGVDCHRFAPPLDQLGLRRRLGFHDDELVILTVAGLRPVKGHALLLEAAARVLALSKRRLRFLWLGDGPERPKLARRIAELGLGEQVQMPGNSDRVAQFLAAADLFVLPSRLEGMSNAILEAMASGLPVVANAVGGNPELIDHGRTGLLCNAGDVDAMAATIGRLVRHDPERGAIGRAARVRAEQFFSLDAMLARYADFYRHAAPLRQGLGASG
jgi:sugar transferase (PEP-CTERM/EpsH1 system associated)